MLVFLGQRRDVAARVRDPAEDADDQDDPAEDAEDQLIVVPITIRVIPAALMMGKSVGPGRWISSPAGGACVPSTSTTGSSAGAPPELTDARRSPRPGT